MKKQRIIAISSLHREFIVGNVVIEALKDVNLEIFEGEFVVVTGPSGSGKTTLLNIIGALDLPTGGEIKVFQHNLAGYDEDFLATFRCVNFGFVFQSYNLISTFTALENIQFPMHLAGWIGAKLKERPKELLDLVGLTERADHFPSQLSGGERQRAAFARALANNPPLFLADEPTGNLDQKTASRIVNILKGLKGEKTIVVATHDKKIVDIADRVVLLSDGRVCQNE
jgi:putative ABC transport system ATP-binding protein